MGPNRIGRANLDGTGVKLDFITSGVTLPFGIAVTANSGIYWVNHIAGNDTAGHANVDGSNPVGSFFDTGSVDVVWSGRRPELPLLAQHIGWTRSVGRAHFSGASPDPNFITSRRRRLRRRGRRQLPVLGRRAATRSDARRLGADPQFTGFVPSAAT